MCISICVLRGARTRVRLSLFIEVAWFFRVLLLSLLRPSMSTCPCCRHVTSRCVHTMICILFDARRYTCVSKYRLSHRLACSRGIESSCREISEPQKHAEELPNRASAALCELSLFTCHHTTIWFHKVNKPPSELTRTSIKTNTLTIFIRGRIFDAIPWIMQVSGICDNARA